MRRPFMETTSDHSGTPLEPAAAQAPRGEEPRDDDETPDHPLDEPPPVPVEDPPPPVTPGPYVAQKEKL
jgi:hypothetical protein